MALILKNNQCFNNNKMFIAIDSIYNNLYKKIYISFALLILIFTFQRIRANEIEDSVVKIYCASQSYQFDRPWRKTSVIMSRGTGFIIRGNKIITNAHVVSDAEYIEVQKLDGPGKFIAKIEFISHGSDLALIQVEDKSFFKSTTPLDFGDMPKLNSMVTTYGYPLGGMQLSVTRGVVSRIEMHTYSHSGIEQHMTIQTDAAINPGNSGGPVIQNNKVVGIAFQGLTSAENVGYLIPTIVVKQFLEDIKDGIVDGFSDLAIDYRFDCENPSVRKILGIPDNMTGVLVTKTYPNMPAWNILKPMDIIMSIEGKKISNDGFIYLDGRKMNFLEIVERIQVNNKIQLQIWRDKHLINLSIPAKPWKMNINLANPYGIIPKYYIFGGLAFTTLSKGYISAIGGWKQLHLPIKILYANAAMLEKYANYKNFPVLSEILPDNININMDQFKGFVVETVNNNKIYSLSDIKKEIENSKEDLIEIKFMNKDVPLIISRKDATSQGPKILEKYHIEKDSRL